MSMTTVYLYGALGRKFGHRWKLDVNSPGEAVRALIANRPDFKTYLLQHSEPGYQVCIGSDPIPNAEGLGYPVGRQAIKIIPVVSGSAKSPWIAILIGAVIIAAAVLAGPAGFMAVPFLSGIQAVLLGSIGASLVMAGISTLLAGTPKSVAPTEAPQNKPSELFSGPVNTTQQGHPVPIGYGRLRVGSAVISAGIVTEEAGPQ